MSKLYVDKKNSGAKRKAKGKWKLWIAIISIIGAFVMLVEGEYTPFVFYAICAILFSYWFKKTKPTKETFSIVKTSSPNTYENVIENGPIVIEDNSLDITSSDLSFIEVAEKYTTQNIGSCPRKYKFFPYLYAETECLLTNLQTIDFSLSQDKIKRRPLAEMPQFKYKSITASTRLSSLRNFVVIDIETTGLKISGNDIIEVAAIKFIDFKPSCIFTSLLKSRKPIPSEATAINHITDDMIADKPYFYQIVPALQDFIGELPIVGHNLEFDIKHLFVNGLDIPNKLSLYDTLELARKYVRNYSNEKLENYKLSTVCSELYICFNDAHRASADALATGLLFVQILLLSHDINNLDEYL